MTLILCATSQEHLAYLSWTLMWFETIFGLNINLLKNELILIGGLTNVDELVWCGSVG